MIHAAETVVAKAAANTIDETRIASVASCAAAQAAVGAVGGTPSVQIVVVPFDQLGDVLPEGVDIGERAFLEGRV